MHNPAVTSPRLKAGFGLMPRLMPASFRSCHAAMQLSELKLFLMKSTFWSVSQLGLFMVKGHHLVPKADNVETTSDSAAGAILRTGHWLLCHPVLDVLDNFIMNFVVKVEPVVLCGQKGGQQQQACPINAPRLQGESCCHTDSGGNGLQIHILLASGGLSGLQ